jgi:preprotein translocase subunit YajC
MLDLLAAGSAQAAPPGWVQFLPIVGMIVIFWFLIIRPQMRKQKEHQARVAGLKKGDQVITAGGLLGKVTRIEDDYAEVEIAPNVRVKALKGTIGDIVAPGGKPAND